MTDPPGPVARIVADVRAGRTSAVEVARATLDAIAERADLAAWAHLDPELVLAEARARDAVAPTGALHGVPVAIKDIIDTADQPTAYGSPIHDGHRPARDATAVARLRAAGAVIMGKTVTTEFALFAPGPTVNPHDPTRTPGGSSSGSAAAVGAGLVPLALGTQTAGSVVRPASFCGVHGAKPTFGRVPVDGVRACAPDLDTVGVFGLDAGDVALALGVIAGEPTGLALPVLASPPVIGWVRTENWDAIDAEVQALLEEGVSRLAASGRARVRDLALPASFDGLTAAQTVLMRTQAIDALAPEVRDHPEALSPTLTDYLAQGPDRVGAARATVHRDAARADLVDAFGDADVLLAPSVLGEAPSLETTGDPLLCRAWTLLGVPCVAVPGLVGPTGLPLGIQVIARPGDDALALAVAAVIQEGLAP